MKKIIPEYIAPCLWSYSIEDIDLKKDKEKIITQVLNYGSPERIKWLYSTYTEDDIKYVVLNPRRGMWFKKVLNFWEIMLEVKIPTDKKEKAIINICPF
ncbi:MAG: hypothetical protein FJW68_09725 [Actinobacteria bacterium]|nr:hypothetical protein [Actinomycetota bacterium]